MPTRSISDAPHGEGSTSAADPGRRITRLLVANRGEIAERIMRTAQAQGITCVVVFSEPDAGAAFARTADITVPLPGATSAETYLDADRLIEVALSHGCDAVHPGYGFLSENPDFAEAVVDAGLTWVGPTADSIRAMALKVPAKELAATAGVPLVPGAEVDLAADGVATEAQLSEIASVGFPLMIKASAGGGGKGMRVVESADALAEALGSASREARSSFGDGTVFVERFLPRARHVEVQVFGDEHGNVVHLFERDCSLQRRNQKILEEAPAPDLSAATRDGLHAAAISLARAVNYVGAGTVEFLVEGDDYFFLEMNTRLQVEHPVTEEVLGLDLVDWQLRVAEGRPLPLAQDAIRAHGHAIEARLYAEDPAAGDMPSVGTLAEFELDDPRLRVDSGFGSGSEVSPHYDPMLAKVIAHGGDRTSAAALLSNGLRAARIHGVRTNRDLLVRVLEDPEFTGGAISTAFLGDRAELRDAHARAAGDANGWRELHAAAARVGRLAVLGSDLPLVAEGVVPPRWRNVRSTLGAGEAEPSDAESQPPQTQVLGVAAASPAPTVALPGAGPALLGSATVRSWRPGQLSLDCTVTCYLHADGTETAYVDDRRHHSEHTVQPRFPDPHSAAVGAGATTPVPGTITAVLVEPGQAVTDGQALVLMEAMKMEHQIAADADGIVADVLVSVGDQVDAHQLVVLLEDPDGAEEDSDDDE